MSTNSIASPSDTYSQALLVDHKTPTTAASFTTSNRSDQSQLSPTAQVLSTFQQLQQSNPSKYQQVTLAIAGNLQTASQSAQKSGDSTAAEQLRQLAAQFSSASDSGQVPGTNDVTRTSGVSHAVSQHTAVQASSGTNESPDALAIIVSTLAGAGITSSSY